MKEAFRFIARTLLTVGIILLLHESIIGVYELTLGRLISLFPASMLIPSGAHYSSSQWMIITLALILTLPGLMTKYRFAILSLSLFGYLVIDLFSFLVWLVPPEVSNTPGVHFTYTEIWSFFGQWGLPLILLFLALIPSFEKTPVSYLIKKKSS